MPDTDLSKCSLKMGATQLEKRLHWVDYTIFAATLVISVGIGFFHAFRDKARTTEQYLVAGRKVHVIPAAMSLMITFLSAVTLLGDAAETYFFGIHYSLYIICAFFSLTIVATVFVPLLHPLEITSLQKYVLLRYNSRAAMYTSYVFQMLLNIMVCGLYLFGPAVMLFAVTGFPVWSTILVLGLVSTVYSTVGGFKAVIWTDAFQTVVIVGALMAITIKGTSEAGGVSTVWRRYQEGGRLHVIYEMSPMNRLDAGTMVFIHILYRVSLYGVQQSAVQRFCSMASLKDAKRCVLLVMPMLSVVALLTGYAGVVAFGYYSIKGCDPYRAGYINNPNQILPFFVMDVLGLPGMPGLFIACIFCGSLSSLSSGYNCVAAMTWEDILKDRPYFSRLNDRRKTFITKSIVSIFGVISILIGFLIMNMKGSIIKMTFTIIGPMFTGSLLIVCLGACFPRFNGKSVTFGSVSGFLMAFWLAVGAQTIPSQHAPLPTTVDNCSSPYRNETTLWSTTINGYRTTTATFDQTVNLTTYPGLGVSEVPANPSDALQGIQHMYKISSMWFMFFGVLVGTVFGLLSTLIPGFSADHVDNKYLFPCARYLWKYGKKEHAYQKANIGDWQNGTDDRMTKSDDMPEKTTMYLTQV